MPPSYHAAQHGYGRDHVHLRPARAIELQIFGEITARLRRATLDADFPRVVAALHDNRRLWTHLAGAVADDSNGLTPALRSQLFYLAEFTALHSQQVLQGHADARVLIDINTAIMEGLGGQVPQGTAVEHSS